MREYDDDVRRRMFEECEDEMCGEDDGDVDEGGFFSRHPAHGGQNKAGQMLAAACATQLRPPPPRKG